MNADALTFKQFALIYTGAYGNVSDHQIQRAYFRYLQDRRIQDEVLETGIG